MSTTTDAAGPWAPLIRVHAGPKWEDPCMYSLDGKTWQPKK